MENPNAARVAWNLRALRKRRSLTLAELSERLAAVGRSMAVNTLSKIENNQRKVDPDDLVALAVALDVAPNRLLLMETVEDRGLELTWRCKPSQRDAWLWACGESPLGAVNDDGVLDAGRLWRFLEENRPHEPTNSLTDDDLKAHSEELAEAVRAVRALRQRGISMGAIAGFVNVMELAERERDRREGAS